MSNSNLICRTVSRLVDDAIPLDHPRRYLCSSKAMMFVKLYFRTSDIYLISLVSLDPWIPWIHQAFICELNRCHPLKRNQYTTYCICLRQIDSISASLASFLGILFSGAVGSVDAWCSARQIVMVMSSNLTRGKIFYSIYRLS